MNTYDRDRGLATFAEVYAGDLAPLPAPGAVPYIDFMLETLFGVLWSDDTLSIRERRLLVLGALAAQGDDAALEVHLRAALKRGELSERQLQAMTTFLTQYVGYPRGSRLLRLVGAVVQAAASPPADPAPR
ncbi:MAG: carboxymuconolactone decarboxylase family protein [Proteobacteria bacterium]|nr:carboxymuconolactone decarboxylase family protein [Pseudomonadota bacterium]